MLVIMPLVTGGALTALLARFGIRLPAGVERLLGLAARAGSGDGIGLVGDAARYFGGGGAGGAAASSSSSLGRGLDGAVQWERSRVAGHDGGGGWGDEVMGVAKMFM